MTKQLTQGSEKQSRQSFDLARPTFVGSIPAKNTRLIPWSADGVLHAHKMQPMATLPPPPPPVYLAMKATDPVLCPICCEVYRDGDRLRKYLVRGSEICAAEELPTTISRALHALPPGGYFRCPMCSYFTPDRLLFTKGHAFCHGPPLLDVRTPAGSVRVTARLECVVWHRLAAASHMGLHMSTARVPSTDSSVVPGSATAVRPAAQQPQRPTTNRLVHVCPTYGRALSTIRGALCRVRRNHPGVTRLRVVDELGISKGTPVHPEAHVCPHCPSVFTTPRSLTRHREALHHQRKPPSCRVPTRMECDEARWRLLVCHGFGGTREKHLIGRGCAAKADAGEKLASFAVDMNRHAPHRGLPVWTTTPPPRQIRQQLRALRLPLH